MDEALILRALTMKALRKVFLQDLNYNVMVFTGVVFEAWAITLQGHANIELGQCKTV